MTECDILVIGGGPTGSTAAMVAARRGAKVILLDKESHPRFRIGESLLPRHWALLKELGLEERVRRLPRTRKLGASFVMGGDETPRDFWFASSLNTGEKEAINIAREPFDAMLAEASAESGADHRTGVAVKSVASLSDAGAEILTSHGESIRARVLIDASGQATLLARHLGTRATLPDLRKVAHYGHFKGVSWREGDVAGSIVIVMCDEGWFWLIPLDAEHVSIGLVVGLDVVKQAGVAANQVLRWGIERCPYVRNLLRNATWPDRNYVTADYSYQCKPYAGPGYFLAGDAAVFVDPIFSTGVCLGMMSAREAADHAVAICRDPASAPRRRRDYIRFVEGSSETFFRLVRGYYTHAFRELFLEGQGPFNVHGAIMTLLAGHVFPKPAWRLRWRQRFFEAAVWMQQRRALAPRRARWSLVSAPVERLPAPELKPALPLNANAEALVRA